MNSVEQDIGNGIKVSLDMLASSPDANAAMKHAQAVLSLSHAYVLLGQFKREGFKGASAALAQ